MTVESLIHTVEFNIDMFSPLDIFLPSMPLARLEPVRQRYVASREAKRYTDWAIRAILTKCSIIIRIMTVNTAVDVFRPLLSF